MTDHDPYEKDSLERLEELQAETDGGVEDFGTYCPTPSECKKRGADVHWLYVIGFPEEMITSIMEHGSPPVNEVKMMINDLGMSIEDVCLTVKCRLQKRLTRKEAENARREMFENRGRRPKP